VRSFLRKVGLAQAVDLSCCRLENEKSRQKACAYRNLCPAVLMVQATEDRHRSDSSNPLDGAATAVPV
jgi:hypothetical protein